MSPSVPAVFHLKLITTKQVIVEILYMELESPLDKHRLDITLSTVKSGEEEIYDCSAGFWYLRRPSIRRRIQSRAEPSLHTGPGEGGCHLICPLCLWAKCPPPLCIATSRFDLSLCPSLGCPDYAGPAADPGTDRHVAPRAAAEHPHPQGADSEDCRGGAVMGRLKNGQLSRDVSSRPRWSSVSDPPGNSQPWKSGAMLSFDYYWLFYTLWFQDSLPLF